MKINTLCILSTYTEAIKMAPVIKRLQKDARFDNQVALFSTQQERMQTLFDLFQIQTDHVWNLHIDQQDGVHYIAKILLILKEFFAQHRPQYVLVLGDTMTAVAVAIAAYYHHIPIGHIEAGLRAWTHSLPWPGEANRKLIGDLAHIHFSPTFIARQNLLREGIASESIYVSGSTAMDALFECVAYIRKNTAVQARLRQNFAYLNPARKMILVTGPQKITAEQALNPICEALMMLAQKFPEIDWVYLLPVDSPVVLHFAGIKTIFTMAAVDYLTFVYLLQASYFVMTDSNCVQEQAPSLGKPVLLLRNETEYVEAIEAGTVCLVGTESKKIVFEASRLLRNHSHYQHMSQAVSPYGDGKAAERIVDSLAKQAKMRAKNKKSSKGLVSEM